MSEQSGIAGLALLFTTSDRDLPSGGGSRGVVGSAERAGFVPATLGLSGGVGAMIARAGIGDLRKSLRGSGFVHAVDAVPAPDEKYFRELEADRRERISASIKRRLHPNTNLHVKQLAFAIGVSDRAVRMILAGDINMSAATLSEMVRFFWSAGDRAFLSEIYGLPPLGVVAELRRPLVEARAMLDQALGQEVA